VKLSRYWLRGTLIGSLLIGVAFGYGYHTRTVQAQPLQVVQPVYTSEGTNTCPTPQVALIRDFIGLDGLDCMNDSTCPPSEKIREFVTDVLSYLYMAQEYSGGLRHEVQQWKNDKLAKPKDK
jgi:hypothetical protein